MPTLISDLKIGVKIGSGHFGEVFLGEDPAHGQVAVKRLTRQAQHSDAAWAAYKASFGDEAKNLSKAKHRNVVEVFHVVEADDGSCVFICVAFCPGGSLQRAFENGPMTLSAVRKVATETLMGLNALHARGMLHRDIKPGNILLDRHGIAQLADFGLVTDDLLLGYGSQAGYSDHIAHELWNGKGTSAKSDIWALGMTLFRLLHGQDWYEEAPNPQNIVPHGGFADTLKWLPHITKPWRTAIRRMLNDEPARRYQNAAQALRAIAQLPVTPIWTAEVTPLLIRWEQRSATRLNVVEWKRHSSRKHEWTAWSEPLGAGRKKTLGGSNGIVSRSEAIEALKEYFGA